MSKDLKPKKELGQHWLFDTDVLIDIVEISEISPDDLVIEVGPGLGTLTRKLLDTGARVVAIEFDTDHFNNLSKRSVELFGKKSAERLRLVHEDALEFRFDQVDGPYKVVANIPYYLTSNLIRKLTENAHPPQLVTLLIQKEVAERLCASPGEMSLLSVWAQMYYDCELGPVVPAGLFTPPPKVDSQVVVMKLLPSSLNGGTDIKALRKVIQAGFSNKRKTLHNSLAAGLHVSKDESRILLERSSIGLNTRPQELDNYQWVELTKNYLTR